MRPLDGIRVVDFTEGAQGPFAASLLADLGAEVVKIERPGGEMMRRVGPFHGGAALPVLSICRGRYATVELDVKAEADFDRIRRLIRNSDVLIQNWKAGTDERNGLSFEKVRQIHPTIVYVRSNGYGVHGPYGRMGSMDSLSQAISGMARLSGDPESGGERTRTPILDFVSAFVTAEAALVGLTARRCRSEAVLVDTSQMSAALEAMAPEVALAGRGSLHPAGARARYSPLGGFFRCADERFIGFECDDEDQVAELCDALGIEEEAASSASVEKALARIDSASAIARLSSVGVCARVVERRFDPKLFDAFPGAILAAQDEAAGTIRHPAPPWIMDRTSVWAGQPLGPIGRDTPLLEELIEIWSARGPNAWCPPTARIPAATDDV